MANKNVKSLLAASQGGIIVCTLRQYMDKNGINRNELATAIGVHYQVINRLYKATHVNRVDLDIIARICAACDCDLPDILQYQKIDE